MSGDPLARTSLGRVCDALSRSVEKRVLPEITVSYGVLEARIEEGSLALAWAPPLLAERLMKKSLVALVSCPVRPGGMTYHSVLFTSAKSRILKPGDLRGARAAWVDPSSLSGGVLARRWCERQGLLPVRTFVSETNERTHSAVARAVLGGNADVGATYANIDAKSGRVVDAGWSEIGAKNEDVRVLATLGPIPADAIVVSRRLPEPVRDACARGMLSLDGPTVAAARSLFRADRFDRPPADYVTLLAKVLG